MELTGGRCAVRGATEPGAGVPASPLPHSCWPYKPIHEAWTRTQQGSGPSCGAAVPWGAPDPHYRRQLPADTGVLPLTQENPHKNIQNTAQ